MEVDVDVGGGSGGGSGGWWAVGLITQLWPVLGRTL